MFEPLMSSSAGLLDNKSVVVANEFCACKSDYDK